MWDYDRLFADGNIIGIKNCYRDKVFNNVVNVTTSVTWVERYKNDWLCCKDQYVDVDDKIKHGYTTDFEIQYIIRLDEHGDVIEKLFDRDKDFIPVLKDGMFVKFTLNDDCFYPVVTGVVVKNKIVSKYGSWCKLSDIDSGRCKIVCIYSDTVNCFDECELSNIIWIDSEYKTRYNIKLNK